MPISGGRVRGVSAAALAGLLVLAALLLPGTAGSNAFAEASATPEPTTTVIFDPSPTPTCPTIGCVVPTTPPPVGGRPTPSPTPRATHTPTRSATPKPRRTSGSSPAPRVRRTTESAPPVTPTLDVGGVQGTPSPTPTVAAKDTSSKSGAGGTLTRLLVLVLGGALVLGLSGAAGLYLTRNHD